MRDRGTVIAGQPALVIPGPDTCDVFSRGKGKSRGNTKRRVAVTVFEKHTPCCQFIQVRRNGQWIVVAAENVWVVLIGHDQDDIGFCCAWVRHPFFQKTSLSATGHHGAGCREFQEITSFHFSISLFSPTSRQGIARSHLQCFQNRTWQDIQVNGFLNIFYKYHILCQFFKRRMC